MLGSPHSSVEASSRTRSPLGSGQFAKHSNRVRSTSADLAHGFWCTSVCFQTRNATIVKDVLDLLGAGVDREEILEEYPDLENEDIAAAWNMPLQIHASRNLTSALADFCEDIGKPNSKL